MSSLYSRTVMTVQFDTKLQQWVVLVSGQVVAFDLDKASLTKRSAMSGKALAGAGYCVELRIRNKRGAFQPARTYGADPRRSKG